MESSPTVTPLESHERSAYNARLNTLLFRELTPETIDTYATNALDEIVAITDDLRSSYRHEGVTWTREVEDAIFAQNDIGDINGLLDHISNVASTISRVNNYIEAIGINATVYTPPDSKSLQLSGEGRRFDKKSTIPRLKTVLFILSRDYGLTTDGNEFTASKGSVTPEMVRKEGYVFIDIPTLARTLLVCDEVENASFVFNRDTLMVNGIEPDALKLKSKLELCELIELRPGNGRRITYSLQFIQDIKAAIDGSHTEDDASSDGHYLVPVATEQAAVSIQTLARQLGVHTETIKNAATELNIPQSLYRFGSQLGKGIKEEHIAQLQQHEMIVMPDALDYGAVSLERVHRTYGIGKIGLEELCKQAEITVGWYRFGSRLRPGKGILSQDLEKLLADDTSPLNTPVGSEVGAMSSTEIAKMLSISASTLTEITSELSLSLGKYRYGSHTSDGYLPSDINAVRQHPKACLPDPDTYNALSIREAARELGTSSHTLHKIISQTGTQTGEFRFSTRPFAARFGEFKAI